MSFDVGYIYLQESEAGMDDRRVLGRERAVIVDFEEIITEGVNIDDSLLFPEGVSNNKTHLLKMHLARPTCAGSTTSISSEYAVSPPLALDFLPSIRMMTPTNLRKCFQFPKPRVALNRRRS